LLKETVGGGQYEKRAARGRHIPSGGAKVYSGCAVKKANCMNTSSSHFLEPYLAHWLPSLYFSSYWWTVLGFFGNLLFSSRFFFQWIASERRRKLFVPGYFWQLSFGVA
jgi:hypothetical protein